MKKISIIALIMVVLLTSCFLFRSTTPHEEFETFEAAIKTLQFTCTEPIVPEGYTKESIIVWVWETLEIIYTNPDSPKIKFRAEINENDELKALNSFSLSLEGVSEEYDLNSLHVLARSLGDKYYFAYWYVDGVALSLHIGEYTDSGSSFEFISKIIESVTNIANNRIEEIEE